MSAIAIIASIGQALIAAIPKIIELVNQNRDPGSIRLEEIISTDAIDKLKATKDRQQDFIDNG